MTLLGWLLGGALVVAVVGLVVVPFRRALPETGQEGPPDPTVRDAIEQELRTKYCLWCGEPYPSPRQSACSACGRPREGAGA